MPQSEKSRISLIVLIAGLAFSIGLLVYVMHSLRATLDHSKSSDIMRSFGQAILLYSNDSHGSYPPDLGTLARTEFITPGLFVSPASGTVIPDNWNSAAEQAKWINANADYVYLGATFKGAMDPKTVVMYEKPKDHGGMNVLYLDGSTLYFGSAATVMIIQQLQAGTNPPLWSSIPDPGRHLGYK